MKAPTLADFPSRPGPDEDKIKAAIIAHLEDDRTVMATVNQNSDFVAALATLLREGKITVDHDYAVHLR